MGRVDELNRTLKSLQSATPEVEAAALISEDGLVIASVLPQQVEEVRVAGMSATLLSLGTRAAAELGRGSLEQVLIKGQAGWVVMLNAAPGTLLLALATQDAKLGLIFLEMKRAVAEIQKVM
jgi:predicted regulator of Ras-like GTPase activity (Roadblock/LC7/MglB family)